MIGVSLPFAWFINDGAISAELEDLLLKLKGKGVASIELRTVRAHHSADAVIKAANLLWDRGFLISVHSEVKSDKTAVDDVFLPLQKLLPALRQSTLNLTVHPINGDNVHMLTSLADHIEQRAYPVTVALENNRLLPDKTEGDCAELVLRAVTAVDRKCIGICFDFGHYTYYRLKNRQDEPNVLPSKDFFARVIHTHIHAVNGLTTHFPLHSYPIPLKEIFDKLSFEYFGLYNLELEFERFQDVCTPEAALLGSIDVLRKDLPPCAVMYDDIRNNFDSRFLSALTVLDKKDGAYFALIHSSSYLFNTNGLCWGMDIAFRNARFLASTPHRCAELLKDLDLMIISHEHLDHFEKSTLEALASTDMEWIIPDFLYDSALENGISPSRIHIAREGETLNVGGITVLPFRGRHFRPGTDKGVLEYGYYVTSENAPSMAFPVDVRDFSSPGIPSAPKADYCFANVWLGDGRALEDSYDPMDGQFAKFMLAFSDKHILITHLDENGRADRDRWGERHGEIVKARINELSPGTQVVIPKCGEVISLEP